MTLESKPRNEGLVAFWATFFLLHLGGQDTITAFSLEDNQLWRRHLLTLVVQASGAGYAIYRYTIPGTWNLVSATIVMFIVGFLKYGERVWALQRGSGRTLLLLLLLNRECQEVILLDAHYIFDFCKGAFSNLSRETRFSMALAYYLSYRSLPYKCDIYMYDVVEAELSLLYDLVYTKAQVAHTWQGYAFLLFRLDDGKGAHSRVDVSITYLLLVGAIILETTSVFRVVGSTRTCDQRRWLHSIGQHNVFDYYCRNQTRCTNMIAESSVLKAWWRKMNFSGNTPITVKFKELVLARILRTMTVSSKIWDSQGKAVLTEYRIFDDLSGYLNSGTEETESADFASIVLNFHVATEIYLYFCNDHQHQSRRLNTEDDDKPLVEAIKVLSNYMGFLMLHPSLLPGGVPSNITNGQLAWPWNHKKCFTTKEIATSLLHREGDEEDMFIFRFSAEFAGKLLKNEKDVPMLQVIFGVWVEFLCYAAHHTTEVSHIAQLGRGGDFLTVIRLVVDHIKLFQNYDERRSTNEASHP
ncbi:hypothetical protein VPH35_101332 [Triticum aestivum]